MEASTASAPRSQQPTAPSSAHEGDSDRQASPRERQADAAQATSEQQPQPDCTSDDQQEEQPGVDGTDLLQRLAALQQEHQQEVGVGGDAGADAAAPVAPAPNDPKRQICFDFTKNQCSRGAACKFSHAIDQIIRVNSQEKGICFDYLKGLCQRGLLCRFSHDLRNLQAPSQANLQAKKRFAPICYDFVKSQCMRGDECKYSHDYSSILFGPRAPGRDPYVICVDYTRGKCTRGASCRYSHIDPCLLGAAGAAAGCGGGMGAAPGVHAALVAAGLDAGALACLGATDLPPSLLAGATPGGDVIPAAWGLAAAGGLDPQQQQYAALLEHLQQAAVAAANASRGGSAPPAAAPPLQSFLLPAGLTSDGGQGQLAALASLLGGSSGSQAADGAAAALARVGSDVATLASLLQLQGHLSDVGGARNCVPPAAAAHAFMPPGVPPALQQHAAGYGQYGRSAPPLLKTALLMGGADGQHPGSGAASPTIAASYGAQQFAASLDAHHAQQQQQHVAAQQQQQLAAQLQLKVQLGRGDAKEATTAYHPNPQQQPLAALGALHSIWGGPGA